MNEVLSLFPVLFFVYVLQCIAAAHTGTVVFLVNFRSQGRLVQRFWQFSLSRYRLFLVNPFFPSSTPVYVCGFPFIFATGPAGEVRGLTSVVSTSAGSSLASFDFDYPGPFESFSKDLLCGDSLVAKLHSEGVAARLAAFLEKLRSTPPPKRRALIDRELERMLALDEIRRRLKLLADSTVYLDSLCTSLFLFLFLLAPVAVYKLGLARIFLGLLPALLFFCLATLWAFHRARRRLYPKRRDLGSQHFFTIALSPFAAIRAIDHLTAGLLEDFHPIAVALALLPKKDFLKFAEAELRRAKFITRDTIWEESIRGFLTAQGFDPQSLLRAPASEDNRSRTYCPACLTQYVFEQGACMDCGGIPLEPLPPSDSSTQAGAA